MTVWAPWIEEAARRHGPAKAELEAMAEHTRILRDALQLQQWDTAFAHGEALFAFLAQQKRRQEKRTAARRAAKGGR